MSTNADLIISKFWEWRNKAIKISNKGVSTPFFVFYVESRAMLTLSLLEVYTYKSCIEHIAKKCELRVEV